MKTKQIISGLIVFLCVLAFTTFVNLKNINAEETATTTTKVCPGSGSDCGETQILGLTFKFVKSSDAGAVEITKTTTTTTTETNQSLQP